MEKVRVRFAPSPTGYLHIGGLRTALFNYLWAKKNNGKFLLRIEDTDRTRHNEDAVKAILDAFKWVGLKNDDEIFYQSQRMDIYKKYIQQLLDEKKAYYIPINHYYLGVGDQVEFDAAREAVKRLFKFKIVGQNLKYDFAIVENNFNSLHVEKFEDTMILAWLLDPERSVGLDNLAKRFFNYDMVKYKDVVKKGEDFSNVDINEACKYASEDAWMTLMLYDTLKEIKKDFLLILCFSLQMKRLILLYRKMRYLQNNTLEVQSLMSLLNKVFQCLVLF